MIKLESIFFQANDRDVLKNLNLDIEKGKFLVICGKSGSGKSVLANIIAQNLLPGKGNVHNPHDLSVKSVPQQNNIRSFLGKTAYYQMRYDRVNNDNIPKVKDFFPASYQERVHDEALNVLRIKELFNKQLIDLSNGESKRFQLAKAITETPDVMILDSPFTGLDKHTRTILQELLVFLKENKIGVLVLTEPQHIPESYDNLLFLSQGNLSDTNTKSDSTQKLTADITLPADLKVPNEFEFTNAVLMKDVYVSYGQITVLNNISWRVKKGECWALTGPNGSGKTTLLSLINGDNPQAYLNDIEVFDKQRGSGDSIWDIKRKIGFVSPELHLFFQRNPSYTEALVFSENRTGISKVGTFTCFDCVASGYQDMIGSSEDISSLKKRQVGLWMEALQIQNLINIPFNSVSVGQQRVVLLARALVKNPSLLILDEPCQGLDDEQVDRFKSIVSEVCRQLNKTLIYVSHYEEEIPDCVEKYFRL